MGMRGANYEWYFTGTYRKWRRKPDPFGHGKFTVSSTDFSWIREERDRLVSKGPV